MGRRRITTKKRDAREELLLFDLPERTAEEIRVEQLRHPVWTENKARLIERYLYYFVLLTKHGTYVDGFAGPQRADNPEMWAAKLVLESKPQRLLHIFLFDISKRQARRLSVLRRLQTRVPGRVVRVFHGDFNVRVRQLLEHKRIKQTEATFCLLDQRTFQCHWNTLTELAKYKEQGKLRIELFYFLAVGWLHRSLSAVRNETLLEQWWGRNDWTQLKDMTASQIKDEIVRRFKAELGYQSAKAWPIYKRRGSEHIVYYMIHATDHPEAPKLMSRAYNQAVQPWEIPEQLSLPLLAQSDKAD